MRSESEVAQSCPTLCDPMGYSLSGSSVHEIFQARVLEWVAISFSRGSSQSRDLNRVSCIAGRGFYHLDFPGPSGKSKRENYHVKVKVTSDSVTPWTVQSMESMEFSRPEYWSGQLFPSPGDLPNPGIKPRSPTLQEESLPAEPQGK